MGPRRSRKTELLKAAEQLFADRGYHGATIRDITAAAKVPLGLATYHFGSKEGLYEAVLRRREPELISSLDGSLSQLLKQKPEPTTDELIEAFLTPHVRLVHADEGWRNYMRILYQLAGFDDRNRRGALLFESFQEVMGRYVAVLGQTLPGCDPVQIRRSLILVRMLQISFSAEGLGGRAAFDSDRLPLNLLPAVVRFCAAGFRAALGPEAVANVAMTVPAESKLQRRAS
jgi:AcrR family transcriptional regulator